MKRTERLFSTRKFIWVFPESATPDGNLFAIGMNKLRIIEIFNTRWKENLKVFSKIKSCHSSSWSFFLLRSLQEQAKKKNNWNYFLLWIFHSIKRAFKTISILFFSSFLANNLSSLATRILASISLASPDCVFGRKTKKENVLKFFQFFWMSMNGKIQNSTKKKMCWDKRQLCASCKEEESILNES